MAVAENFAANLRKVVARMGGSVNGAAQAWKVPTKTLESVLKGQRVPSLDTAERLANAVSPEEAELYARLSEMAKHLPSES